MSTGQKNDLPHVTAAMITGKHLDRIPLARVAIDCFRQQ